MILVRNLRLDPGEELSLLPLRASGRWTLSE